MEEVSVQEEEIGVLVEDIGVCLEKGDVRVEEAGVQASMDLEMGDLQIIMLKMITRLSNKNNYPDRRVSEK